MELTAADLTAVRDLYLQGRYRQALQASEPFGPLKVWRGPAAMLLAGRLAIQLGAPRTGRQLHLVAIRQSPTYPEAIYYHARYRLEHYGALSCWQYMRQHQDWSIAAPEVRGDWLALQGLMWGRFRDFDRAEKALSQAETQAADRAWLQVERASVLEIAERLEDSLAAARRSLDVQPWFRPGVQAVAHTLTRLGRVSDAISFLEEAITHLESGAVVAQLASLHYDRGEYSAAKRYYEQYVELSPLIEPTVHKWLAARNADVLYLLGNSSTAREHALQVQDDFYNQFAEALTQPVADSVRKILTLDWQLPASPSTPPSPQELLGRFWNKDAPKPRTDSPPLMDGLPDASDRRLWEEAGWAVREFRFELPAVKAAVDAGIPVLLTLVEAGYSQARLLLGYDTTRQTIFLADPVERRLTEAPVETLFKRYAPFGPRCLAVAPTQHGWPEFAWPDQTAHDELHQLQCRLAENQFSAARELLQAIKAARPLDRLTLFAELAWARATNHPVLLLDAITALRKLYPTDNSFLITEAAVLRDLGRMPERLELLLSRADLGDTDPLVVQSAAQLLMSVHNRQSEADRLLRSSIRRRPQAAAGYYLLASLWWEQQRFEEATELYRMAVCLDEREEQFAEAYSRAARVRDQVPEALRLFQQRAYRQATPFPPSVRALFFALLDREETEQAFAALGKAIDQAQEEVAKGANEANASLAELLLLRAEQQANFGRAELAEADLSRAKPLASPAAWFKSAARAARSKPDFALALDYLKGYLQQEPLSAEGHRLTTTLYLDTAGRPAAKRYLAEVCSRFPDFYPIVRYRAEFLYTELDDSPITATQALIELCPRDAWAHRQLALVYADRKNHLQAQTAADRAGTLEPEHPSQFAVQAHVHRRADRIDEALATFRAGISLYPDHELAIAEMVQISRGLREKKATLRYVAEVLHDKPHTGEGLVTYFEQSLRLMDDPDEQEKFLVELERFLDERPDLWQAWSVVCQLLLMSHRAEESAELARQATERFPLVPRVWIDLAEASASANRPEERLEALRQAVAVAPGWVPAVREYAEVLGEAEQYEEAIRALERVVARSPLDPLAHWYLAERLWDADRSREALDRAKQAVRMDTGADPRAEIAWAAVMNWSERLDAPEEAAELARSIAANRSGDPQAWLRVARCLTEYSQSDEALRSLETAIRLDPRNVEAHDMKSERLAALGQYEEARQAALPEPFIGEVPLVLQGRAAWVEARRGNYTEAIQQMQALVAIDPEYLWGWQQLAEWYNATGQHQSYLQAANELMRLRPEHPLSLTMRGEARILTSNREEGKSDLREALRISPNYSPAAAILFDACLEDDENREARSALAVLQEHMAGTEVLLKQLQFARHTQDAEAAARAFSEICLSPGEAPPHIMQAGLHEMQLLDLEDRAAELMKEAWSSGEEFNPWAAMLWVDLPQVEVETPEQQLQALEALLKYYPDFLPALDRRAELLTNHGRYDEAKAACWGIYGKHATPVALRGRAAWIDAQSGDKAKAIEQMEQILKEHPEYSWGWRQLTYWYDELNRHEDCLSAADQLVRLNPTDAVAYAIRGESKRLLGDHRGAKADYQQAFELDPTFEAAGLQLVSAQLATDELTEAEHTLKKLREHSTSSVLLLQQVQLSARQGRLDQARQQFRELLQNQQLTRGKLREAALAMGQAGWDAEVEQEFEQQLRETACPANTAGLWVERLLKNGQADKILAEIPQLANRNPVAAREAILTYAWGQLSSDPASSVSVLQQFADVLRSDSESWGRAGGLLAEAKQYALTIAWLGDWQTRDDLQSWMLVPLADAYRHQEHDDESMAICRAAVKLETLGDPSPEFLAWLGLADAVEGRTAEAQEWLAELDTVGVQDGVQLIAAMAQSLILVQTAAASEKGKLFQEAKDHLLTAVGACAAGDIPPGASRWYQKVVQRLAMDAGGVSAKLWAWWQKFRPAL